MHHRQARPELEANSEEGAVLMPKFCPFADHHCFEAACALWTTTNLFVGAGKYETVSQCAFTKIADGIDGIAGRG